ARGGTIALDVILAVAGGCSHARAGLGLLGLGFGSGAGDPAVDDELLCRSRVRWRRGIREMLGTVAVGPRVDLLGHRRDGAQAGEDQYNRTGLHHVLRVGASRLLGPQSAHWIALVSLSDKHFGGKSQRSVKLDTLF